MKMSVILGKKQIILASLVTILGIAVYLNYIFTDTGNADLEACGAPYEFYNRGYSARYESETMDDAVNPDEMEDGTDET